MNELLFTQGKADCRAGLPPQSRETAYLDGYLAQVHQLPVDADGFVQYPTIAALQADFAGSQP